MYANISATELSRMIHQKQAKPSEICAYFLAQSEKKNPQLNIFNAVNKESAMNQALEMDNMNITAETSPVFGLPIALKDNISTIDLPTTCSSKMLKNYQPVFDAAVTERLREQNAIIFGKTNMNEFAVDTSDNTMADAVAVAENCVPFSLTSYAGGGAVKSASAHGLISYKPSRGAVSRHGLIPLAGSFDQIGTLCRTVSDTAMLAKIICNHDTRDSISNPNFTPDFSQLKTFDIKKKRIGILNERADNRINSTAKIYESLGAESVDISIPSLKHIIPAYYAILYAEASSNLSRLDGIRFGCRSKNYDDIDSLYINSRTEGFGLAVKKAIMLGTYILTAGNIDVYYKKACILKKQITDEFTKAFELCDIIILPTEDEADVTTASFTGLPAVSIPHAESGNIQLIGNSFDDENLLKFAYALERESNVLKKGAD